jgi:phosphoglycolate phosphatase
LIDSALDIASSVNYVRSQFELPPLAVNIVESYIGDGVHALLSRALQTSESSTLETALAHWWTHYDAHCLDHTCLYPGIKESLECLRSLKVPLAVVTNKPAVLSEKILQGLGIRPLFQAVVGGDTTPRKKPHPEPVLHAISLMKLDSRQILVVGDSPNDIIAAQRAGLKSCGVLWGLGLEQTIRNARPNYLVQMPDDIQRIIRTHQLG